MQQGNIGGEGGGVLGASYRLSETNHCPDCGQTQWFVGRMSAECAVCHTALPISGVHRLATGMTRTSPAPLLAA
ncbi:hypothetical protein ACBY01_03250 [Sphingomonas sp. ac-8]|uniref:hypothetical protein n=1 Tax=Sphingomonas sp. ac-8 TaxID=3242977 RepID=UPI003A80ABEE